MSSDREAMRRRLLARRERDGEADDEDNLPQALGVMAMPWGRGCGFTRCRELDDVEIVGVSDKEAHIVKPKMAPGETVAHREKEASYDVRVTGLPSLATIRSNLETTIGIFREACANPREDASEEERAEIRADLAAMQARLAKLDERQRVNDELADKSAVGELDRNGARVRP